MKSIVFLFLILSLNILSSNVGRGNFERDCAGLKANWTFIANSVHKLNLLGKTLENAINDKSFLPNVVKSREVFAKELDRIAAIRSTAADACTSIFTYSLLNKYKKLEKEYDQFINNGKSDIPDTLDSNFTGQIITDCKHLNELWSAQYHLLQRTYILLKNALEVARATGTKESYSQVVRNYSIFIRVQAELDHLVDQHGTCEVIYTDGLHKSFEDLKAEYEKFIPAEHLEILKKNNRHF